MKILDTCYIIRTDKWDNRRKPEKAKVLNIENNKATKVGRFDNKGLIEVIQVYVDMDVFKTFKEANDKVTIEELESIQFNIKRINTTKLDSKIETSINTIKDQIETTIEQLKETKYV
jgi:hypothetical protein